MSKTKGALWMFELWKWGNVNHIYICSIINHAMWTQWRSSKRRNDAIWLVRRHQEMGQVRLTVGAPRYEKFELENSLPFKINPVRFWLHQLVSAVKHNIFIYLFKLVAKLSAVGVVFSRLAFSGYSSLQLNTLCVTDVYVMYVRLRSLERAFLTAILAVQLWKLTPFGAQPVPFNEARELQYPENGFADVEIALTELWIRWQRNYGMQFEKNLGVKSSSVFIVYKRNV